MTLYAIQVETPSGPRLVGPWYRSKAVCKSWVPFVKSAWHGMRTRTREFSLDEARRIQERGGQE